MRGEALDSPIALNVNNKLALLERMIGHVTPLMAISC